MWARSLGHHAYFGGLFNLDEYNDFPDCKYALFDDINGGFKFLPSYKQWLGQQQEFHATDRYRKKQRIQWGRPTIWLSNNSPYGEDIDHDWLEANCIIVHLEDSLF